MNDIVARQAGMARRSNLPAQPEPTVIDGEVVARKPLVTPARIAGAAVGLISLVAGWQGVEGLWF